MDKTSKVVLEFPTDEQRDVFMSWLSSSGEQEYMDATEACGNPQPINKLDYTFAFKAWGYDPEKDGDPRITFHHIDE